MFRFSILMIILLSCQLAFPAVFASQKALDDFDQVKTAAGQVMLRIEMKSTGPEPVVDYQLSLSGGSIARMNDYFFESGEDNLNARAHTWSCKASDRHFHSMPMNLQDMDVVVAWLDQAGADSRIELRVNDQILSFTLDRLFREQEFRAQVETVGIVADLLLDKEIGEPDPKSVGISGTGDDYDFIILADTHIGKDNDLVNEYMARIIGRINDLEPNPAFVMDIGDLVTAQGGIDNFNILESLVKPLRAPFLMLVGNHESEYKSDFYPGYNMEPFADYFTAQKNINGMDDILYSYNVGEWHFVVLPDPHRNYFYQKHPHYFDWLRQDLEKNKDRPTMVFQHIHSLPLGINPMTNYVNPTQMLNEFFDCLAEHGNVKYLISGHTHIPLRAAFKTAMQYRGIDCINLPASSNYPRNFGEPDFDGETSRGFVIAHVHGDKLELSYQMVDGGLYEFPRDLPEFDPNEWQLWLKEPWQLPANPAIRNGGFEKGLDGWVKRYVYLEDKDPANARKVTTDQANAGSKSLYLYTRKRGYDVEGDNRMTQTLNYVCQAVSVPGAGTPLLTASFMPDGRNYSPDADAGSYVLVDGYNGSTKKLALVYWVGRGYFKPRGLWSSSDDYTHFDLSASPDLWHKAAIDVAGDYNRKHDTPYTQLGIDRLVVQLGTWDLNQRTGDPERDKLMRTGIYWDDIEMAFPEAVSSTTLDGKPVEIKPEDQIESRWLMGGMGDERKH